MSKYQVDVPEVWIQTYTVEAEGWDEAIDKVKDDLQYGTGETHEAHFEYSHLLDTNFWEAREIEV